MRVRVGAERHAINGRVAQQRILVQDTRMRMSEAAVPSVILHRHLRTAGDESDPLSPEVTDWLLNSAYR